jgi:hypothetical protein
MSESTTNIRRASARLARRTTAKGVVSAPPAPHQQQPLGGAPATLPRHGSPRGETETEKKKDRVRRLLYRPPPSCCTRPWDLKGSSVGLAQFAPLKDWAGVIMLLLTFAKSLDEGIRAATSTADRVYWYYVHPDACLLPSVALHVHMDGQGTARRSTRCDVRGRQPQEESPRRCLPRMVRVLPSFLGIPWQCPTARGDFLAGRSRRFTAV